MSVIVKGMEMPERCGQCILRCDCKQRIYMEQRPKGCPLVEIPPHGRLIDADKLVRDTIYNKYITETILSNAPTVIEAEGSET